MRYVVLVLPSRVISSPNIKHPSGLIRSYPLDTNMMSIRQGSPQEVVHELLPSLQRSPEDPRPVVVMTCGIAGSGKTSLAKELLRQNPSMQRLSIDEIVASRHGIWNIDYNPDKYSEHQDEADVIFRQSLRNFLAHGKSDVILDRSFYAKEDRDEFKQIVERNGGKWVLVYLKVPREVLWGRIQRRREMEIDANSALEISTELFEMYVKGFEHPGREGEIVVEYTV
ncbi:hypothetical protein AC578_4289 [Pseudocercospora eumusae]|uniref:Zeta toxin domain-containing protein n=1 Tax=Pseudocercospora eumusae TaxID=321146 RepID=A0A139H7Z1_9PEZI|nr:hypothetical protein AC578_4289 [Pseudocercospora eumusae]